LLLEEKIVLLHFYCNASQPMELSPNLLDSNIAILVFFSCEIENIILHCVQTGQNKKRGGKKIEYNQKYI